MKQTIITGAGSGIGRAIALKFAGRGDHVFALDFNSDAASKVVEEIKELYYLK